MTRQCKLLKSLLSLTLAIVMVVGIVPPIQVSAADGGTGGLKISSPSDKGTVNGYDTVKITWNKYSGRDHYRIIVKDEKTGDYLVDEEQTGTTYRVYSDDYVFTTQGRKYKIYVAAMDEDGNVMNDGSAWNSVYVTNKLELETPEITSHDFLDTHCIEDTLYVEWDPVDCADSYTVSVKKLNGAPDYDNDNEPGTNITYSWSDDCEIKVTTSRLTAGKWYKIAMCANNKADGVSSEWTSVYILMEEKNYLEVSAYADDLDAAKGSTGSFWINSNMDWTIKCNKTWLTWIVNQVDDTHAEIIVKATSANTGTSDREAKFTISADGVDDEYVYVYQLAPEIEEPSIDNVSISNSVSLGGKITWSATVDGNGSLLDTVTVGVYSRVLDDSIYFRNTNIGKETYSLSGSVLTGGTVSGYDASGNPKTLDMSYAGEYTVTIHAKTNAAKNNYVATTPVTITLTEPEDTGILGDVNSDGCVSDMDLFIFKRYLDKVSGYTVNRDSSDINGDGSITVDDYNILKNYLVSNTGYENLYNFIADSTSKPKISGVNQVYYVEKGSSLKIPFTLTAQNSGKIEKVTLKHCLVGTSFSRISYTCNQNSYSNSFTISGYPLDQVGMHTFVIYCRASNYTVTNNEIIIFNVYVTEKECSHDNYDDQYLRTVYAEKHKTLVEHTYYHEYKSVCKDCGYEICTVAGDSVTEGHKLNSKGYCLCGYINTSGYAIWEGYNSSGKNITVYSNPEATAQYGLIYANESVTVLGECCGRYLIEYDLDSGGTKQGYVAKNNISEYVNNTTSAKYSLAIDDEYFFEADGLKIWFTEQYGYSKVNIIDNNTGLKVSYSQNNLLKWSLKYNNNDNIDDYGTLCMRSAPSEFNILELYYDGELMDSISCMVVNDKTRATIMDCVEDWNSKLLFINDYCIITDYSSVYNAANDTYTVTMKVYNKSPVAFGIGSMSGNTTGWYDFQYVNTYWEDFSLVEESVATFEMFADAFTESNPLTYIAYLEDSEKTDIELTVPAGGRIVFAGPADSTDVLYANIAELVIAILATSDDFVALLGSPIKADNISNMISNAKFVNKVKTALINFGLDELIKSALSNKDGIHAMRDIITIFTNPNNEEALKQLMLTVAECSDSAFKDITVDMAKKIESLCAKGFPPANLIVKGTDTVLSCLQTIQIVAANINIIKNEKTFNEIGFWVQYPNE